MVVDTSKVTNMWFMFASCSSLEDLNLSNFDTSSVTDMSWMFGDQQSPSRGCGSLTSLDLSNFDTSNVTDMYSMVGYCSKLTTIITILNSKTSNYPYMFYEAATDSDAQITVDYTSATSDLVDQMITTGSRNSNVVKGALAE